MGETHIERQAEKGREPITTILASRQNLKHYEVDHSAVVETKKNPSIARAFWTQRLYYPIVAVVSIQLW